MNYNIPWLKKLNEETIYQNDPEVQMIPPMPNQGVVQPQVDPTVLAAMNAQQQMPPVPMNPSVMAPPPMPSAQLDPALMQQQMSAAAPPMPSVQPDPSLMQMPPQGGLNSITQPAPQPVVDPNAALASPAIPPMQPAMDPNMIGGLPMDAQQAALSGMAPPMPSDIMPMTPDEMGNLRDLKDVFQALNKIQSILDYYGDSHFDPIKTNCSKALRVFNDLISNYDLFKQRVPQMVAEFTDMIKLLTSALGDAVKVSNDRNESKIDNEEKDSLKSDDTELNQLVKSLFKNNKKNDEDDEDQ